MTHPLIPQILEIAAPIADNLGLEVVDAVFQTHQSPPILRVDIRHPHQHTSLDDCERMSHALEAILDTRDIIPGTYVLEISSPGIARQLTSDREFQVFRGFPVVVITEIPYENQKEWRGKLQGRDEEAIYLNQKGRTVAIPRHLVATLRLDG